MSAARLRPFRRLSYTAVALLGAGALVAGCTSNTPEETSSSGGGGNNAASSNDDSGDTVTIGFSAPAADHGWMAGITEAARAEADKYDDVELSSPRAPTTSARRSARSRPSSTTRSTPSCCCPSTARP